jgi:Uma2 family endonuclease
VRYEFVDGQWVEMPPMSAFASIVASRLVRHLNAHAVIQDLGEAYSETLVRLPLNGGRQRRPDGVFVSYQRWPKSRPFVEDANAWDVVPDLAIEVVSPTDLAEDVLEKVEEYFRAGVSLVWVVYPRLRLVHVYESLTRIRGLTRTDELDGGAVLPGFRVPLATLFPEEAALT